MAKILFLFYSSLLYSADFFISEIYANPPGNTKNYGSQWIELYNLTSQNIIIKKLQIIFLRGKKNDTFFDHTIHFDNPIIFDYALLLGQDKFLGFEEYLSTPVITIEDEKFFIESNQKQSLCFSINDSPFICANLLGNQKFLDGISLYPIVDNKNQVHWQYEDCELMPDIKATPGFLSKDCKKNASFIDDVFIKNIGENNIKIYPILNNISHLPNISLEKKENINLFSIKDQDNTDIWSIKLCESNIKNICKEIDNKISIDLDSRYFFSSYIKTDIWVRDLYGNKSIIKEEDLIPSKEQIKLYPKNPKIKFDHSSSELVFLPNAEEIPFNFTIIKAGKKILSGTKISSLEKTIFLGNIAQPPINIEIIGPFGKIEHNIK